jgi:hypothetical protein
MLSLKKLKTKIKKTNQSSPSLFLIRGERLASFVRKDGFLNLP